MKPLFRSADWGSLAVWVAILLVAGASGCSDDGGDTSGGSGGAVANDAGNDATLFSPDGGTDGTTADTAPQDARTKDTTPPKDTAEPKDTAQPDTNDGDIPGDTTSDQDAGGDADTGPNFTICKGIAAGDLVITEVLYDPKGTKDNPVSDNKGEWFEVYNTTDKELAIAGMWIGDDDKDAWWVADTAKPIPPKSFYVFGVNADEATNGGVKVDFEYGKPVNLENTKDAIILKCGDVIVDDIYYDKGANWPKLTGVAMALSPTATDAVSNNLPTRWCPATSELPSGDKGSPGKANDVCPNDDKDDDGVPDGKDNCPNTANPKQFDSDYNGIGDNCEPGYIEGCGDYKKEGTEECDDGNGRSGDGCSFFCTLEKPIPAGSLIITEFQTNPAAVPDNQGEWVEIHNISGAPVQLNGLQLQVDATPTAVVHDPKAIVLAAGGYFVIGVASDTDGNGGANVGFVTSSKVIVMPNTKGAISIWSGKTQLDEVVYHKDNGWVLKQGKSTALDPGLLDATKNDDPTSWCVAQVPYGDGDFGTPGLANLPCAITEDSDNDGVPDKWDNCPNDKNKDQKDSDNDGFADACDTCPAIVNKDQKDSNGDGVGDACEKVYCGNGILDGGDECDDGNGVPGDGCSILCKKEVALVEGDLVISEFISNPKMVSDTNGEWIELYNPTQKDHILDGLEVVTGKGSHIVIGDHDGTGTPLVVKAGSYVVLGASATETLNGGVKVDYVWHGLGLTNPTGSIKLLWNGKSIDELQYDSAKDGWPAFKAGRAMSLSEGLELSNSNHLGDSWCNAETMYGMGDYGTPGKPNPKCPVKVVCGDKILGGDETCDDGNDKAGDGCSDTCQKEAPILAPGALVIVEFMARSATGTDSGEWVELYNPTTVDIDLRGMEVRIKSKTLPISATTPIIVKAGGYFVIGITTVTADNGDTPVDLALSGLSLADAGSVVELAAGATVVDSLAYDSGSGWPTTALGISVQLSSDKLNAKQNDEPTAWCPSIAPYGNGGNKGTPGKTNAVCATKD